MRQEVRRIGQAATILLCGWTCALALGIAQEGQQGLRQEHIGAGHRSIREQAPSTIDRFTYHMGMGARKEWVDNSYVTGLDELVAMFVVGEEGFLTEIKDLVAMSAPGEERWYLEAFWDSYRTQASGADLKDIATGTAALRLKQGNAPDSTIALAYDAVFVNSIACPHYLAAAIIRPESPLPLYRLSFITGGRHREHFLSILGDLDASNSYPLYLLAGLHASGNKWEKALEFLRRGNARPEMRMYERSGPEMGHHEWTPVESHEHECFSYAEVAGGRFQELLRRAKKMPREYRDRLGIEVAQALRIACLKFALSSPCHEYALSRGMSFPEEANDLVVEWAREIGDEAAAENGAWWSEKLDETLGQARRELSRPVEERVGGGPVLNGDQRLDVLKRLREGYRELLHEVTAGAVSVTHE